MVEIKEISDDEEQYYGPQRPRFGGAGGDTMPMLNGKGTDWQPLSESNWEQELDNIPLFMKKAPTQQQLAENEELQALQSLIYDGTPVEIAQSFKEQANEILATAPEKQRRHYQEAQKLYEKALEQKCGDLNVEVSVMSNLAHVHFQLANYRSSFESCLRAFKLIDAADKENNSDSIVFGFSVMVKLYYRMCKAYLALSKVDECREWLQKAEEFCKTATEHYSDVTEKNVSSYSNLFQNINGELKDAEAELQRRERIRLDRERAIQDRNRQLATAINERHLTILKAPSFPDDANTVITPATIFPCPPQFLEDQHGNVHLISSDDEEAGYPANSLNWPVLLIYPQLNTFDMIGAWNESVSIMDQLEQQVFSGKRDDLEDALRHLTMNEPCQSKDSTFEYNAHTVAAYVLSKDGKWLRVRLLQSLGDLLKQTVLSDDLVVRIWIVPKLDSQQREFTRDWIKSGPQCASAFVKL